MSPLMPENEVMWRWQDVLPVAALIMVLSDLMSFAVGYERGQNIPPDPLVEAAHVLRHNVETTCKARPDIIAEANRLLRDNSEALITPADVRKVVTDVVERCP